MPGTEQPTDGLVKEHVTDESTSIPTTASSGTCAFGDDTAFITLLLYHLIAKSSGLRDVGKNILVAD
jgi:hypothetical protein